MKKAFTLVEMLVVIGIIVVLMAALVGGYASISKTADRTKCQELVDNTATALANLFLQKGVWPKGLRTNGSADGELDETVSVPIAFDLGLTKGSDGRLSGYDKFGIVTPWATAYIKRHGSTANRESHIPSGGRLMDHVFHYALDLDGDGLIHANVGGDEIDIRATVAVWCCGRDGKVEPYNKSRGSDDVHSWTRGQTLYTD